MREVGLCVELILTVNQLIRSNIDIYCLSASTVLCVSEKIVISNLSLKHYFYIKIHDIVRHTQYLCTVYFRL